jgi:hypothetical protein
MHEEVRFIHRHEEVRFIHRYVELLPSSERRKSNSAEPYRLTGKDELQEGSISATQRRFYLVPNPAAGNTQLGREPEVGHHSPQRLEDLVLQLGMLDGLVQEQGHLISAHGDGDGDGDGDGEARFLEACYLLKKKRICRRKRKKLLPWICSFCSFPVLDIS